MRTLMFLLGAAALATPSAALMAQETQTTGTPPPGEAPIDRVEPGEGAKPMTPPADRPMAEAEVKTWPQDRQEAYSVWSAATKDYFWSLAPERQELFWRLRDTDRQRVSQMGEAEREQAWQVIERQAQASPPQSPPGAGDPPMGG